MENKFESGLGNPERSKKSMTPEEKIQSFDNIMEFLETQEGREA